MKKTLIESLVSMATELCNRGQNPWLAAANAVKLLKEPVTPEDMKAVDDELKRRFSGREPKPWETEQTDLFNDIGREACYHCDGTGRIEDPDDFPNLRTCPICEGTGDVPAPAPTGADAALSALEKETYTDLFGDVIQVESLLWLEDGKYYDEEQGEYCDCSRYCTNSEEKDADGESVWLNEDYQEVDPDAEQDYDDEEGEEVDE